ncbi:MAG TPA: cytochrome b [Allosphingosinicella sp.]|nr:cytochrome b [Allosphingosinicella sp.]
MAGSSHAARYSRIAIVLHWAIAILILVNLPLGIFNEEIEAVSGSSPMWLHKSIGLSVLVLSIARLAWRLAHRPPPLPETVGGWRRTASRVVHRLFYAFMILVPLTGWIRTSAGSYPLTWFALFDVPKFAIERDTLEASAAATVHEVLAWSLLALVVLHVAAALHHHYILRDRVLVRILPSNGARHVERRCGLDDGH